MNSLLNVLAGKYPVINPRFPFIFLLAFLVNNYAGAQCNTLPDNCSNACYLGTLPTPAACSGSTNSVGGIDSFNLTNVGATAGSGAASGCAYPAADVWYSFTATGTELLLNITSALHSVNVSLYQGNNCDSLNPITCFSVAGGNMNESYSPITPGTTYYMQISGGYIFDQAAFKLKISNNLECNNCVLNKSLTVSPPPVNGTYSPGQTVSFCFQVLDYNQGPTTEGNTLHGIVLSFGDGWDSSTLTPTYIPPSCIHDSGAYWGFFARDSSTHDITAEDTITQKIYGPGFFYVTWRGVGTGPAPGDTIPGENEGDEGVTGTACQPTFCWKITTKSSLPCPNDASLNMTVRTTGDGQSGDYFREGCVNDPVSSVNAVLSCCSPPAITAYNTACGKINGRAVAEGNGYAPWHYTWLNDAGTVIANDSMVYGADSIANLPIGQYFVTVFDSTGCSNFGIANIGVQPKDSFGVNVKPVCYGSTNDGMITLIPYVLENGPFTYQFDNGAFQDTNVFSNLTVRKDTIVVLNSYGCTDTFKANITLDPQLSIITDTVYPVTCAVGGEVVVTVNGGTAPFTYSWPDSLSGNPVYNLPQGNYTLTVTDAGFCTDTASYTITVGPNAILFGPGIIKPPSCDGTHDASLTAEATGRGAVKYHWYNGDTSATLTNLSAGFYSVTATDTAGCVASYTYRIVNPVNVVIDRFTILPQSCSQGGVIHVIASGGTDTLTYVWSQPSLTGDSVTNLSAGQYTVTVHDVNDCSTTAAYTVNSIIYSLSFNAPDITNPACNGYADGSITVLATGYIGTVKYHWNNNDTTSTITGLPSGTYTVVATDSNQCSASATYTITQPAVIQPALSYKPVMCFGIQDDTVTASASGGTPGYAYKWSNGDTSATDALPKGNFSITVTDSKDCTATASGNISQEDTSVSNTNILTLHLCSNPAHGDLLLVGDGGIPPYTYTVVGVGTDSSGQFPGLAPGTYMFDVTDSVGCQLFGGFGSVTIPNSVANDSFDITVDSATCYGLNNGTIIVTPLNTGPFSYQLDGGTVQNSDTFTNVGAGNHTVVANNVIFQCTYTLDATVNQPLQHVVSITPDSVISSPGTLDTLIVSTDFTNAVYTWSPVTGLGCPTCDTTSILVDSSANNTYYKVKVYSAGDSVCYVSDSVLVLSHYPVLFAMPTAFTPNGDGHDDLFGPAAKMGAYSAPAIKEFRIYNRFGELVHNSNTPWDGTFDGKEQPVGTYIYYIEVQINNPGETTQIMKQEGAVTLLR